MISWEFLPFNLRWVRQLTWETTEGDCEGSPLLFPDETTGIDLIFRISLQEFTKVLSALEKGATLSYPSEDWDVVWFFLRNFECPMPICEQIINCVNNDIDTQQAIASMLAGNQSFNDFLNTRIVTLTSQLINTKLIAGGDCDPATLAGRIKSIVDGMNQANLDWFEKIETGTNSEEKFSYVWSAIPGVGSLPVDEVVDFGQDILEDFAEIYAGQVDADLLQDWYCGLYCEALKNDDCSLTYGQIYDYFAKRVGSGLNPFSTLQEVMNFIVFGEFDTGTRIADATMALQTGLMVNGREFFGSNLPSLQFLARDAGTSTFYEDCDDCPTEELWLSPLLSPPGDIELVTDDGTEQTWLLHNVYTGNYLTGGAASSNGTPFAILSVDYGSSVPGANARFVTDFGTYSLDTLPCEFLTTKLWCYEVNEGTDITIVISRTPCSEGQWTATTGEITSVVGNETTFTPASETAGWVVEATFTAGKGLDMTSTGFIDYEEFPVNWWWWNENGTEIDGLVTSPGIMTRVRFEFSENVPVIIGGGEIVDV